MSYVLNPGSGGAGATPGGSDKDVQFNDGGSFGGDSDFTFDKTAGAEQVKISASSSTELLKITQTGTGDALMIEDSASPDNTPFRVNNNGKVGIGVAPSNSYALRTSSTGNIEFGTNGFITGGRHTTTQNGSPTSTRFSRDIDQDTGMYFPGTNQVGFSTAGSERLRFGDSGQIGLGGANYGTAGQVLTSGGPSGAVSWAAAGGGSNDFDLQITQNDIIAGNQRWMLHRLPGWGAIGNASAAQSNQNNPICRPFIAWQTGEISELGVECTTADATGTTTLLIGIYSDNDGVPQTRLGTAIVAATSTGQKYVTTFSNTINITRGQQYWYVACRSNQTNNLSFRSQSNGSIPFVGPSNAVGSAQNMQGSLQLNSSANTLPATINAANLQITFINPLQMTAIIE